VIQHVTSSSKLTHLLLTVSKVDYFRQYSNTTIEFNASMCESNGCVLRSTAEISTINLV